MKRVAYGKFKPGRGIEVINWFKNKENVAEFTASLPEGVEFEDLYLFDRGALDHDFEIVYKIKNYAVLDNWDLRDAKFKESLGKFIDDLGFYSSEFNEKFIISVDEAVTFEEERIKGWVEKEKDW